VNVEMMGVAALGTHVWDMTAAGLILEWAGGTVEILQSYPNKRFAVLATNGRLQTACRDALQPLLQK